MIKRNVKLMTTLALALSLSIGVVTANAATAPTPSDSTQKIEHKVGKDNEHVGSIHSILKNNLGFTDAQIDNGRNSGKTAFDLAKEKGKTPDQLKAMIIEAQSKRIDEAVANGKITKEKAVTAKTNLKTKMQNWDGNLKQKGHSKGKFKSVNLVLKNNLGFTDAEIKDATNSGKTAFDLAKEKGKTPDQLKVMIIEAQSKRIDEAVANGKITKEKAVTIKTNLKTKMQNWDGSLNHKNQGKKAK
jgi:polyhydroxyalkanoate synthesis regulator phasin